MKEILINIDWRLIDFDEDLEDNILQSNETEIEYDDDKVLIIKFYGLDSSAKFWVHELGRDAFDEYAIDFIKNHVKKLIEYEPTLSDVLKSERWIIPKDGEFILVLKINSYRSNHPLDPEEWDMDIETIGVLGDQVKLVY